MTEKIKVYLCARISKDAHRHNEKICSSLNSPISVFMPQKHNPWNIEHKKFPKEVFDLDLKAIKESHICLALAPYGRDCAWEIGWYSNSIKPIVLFTEENLEWLEDWMIKGGINYIVTTSKKAFSIIKKDPILRYKEVLFIKNLSELNKILIKVYRSSSKFAPLPSSA